MQGRHLEIMERDRRRYQSSWILPSIRQYRTYTTMENILDVERKSNSSGISWTWKLMDPQIYFVRPFYLLVRYVIKVV